MKTSIDKAAACKKITVKLSQLRISLGYSANKVREKTDIDVNKIEHNGSNLTVFTLCILLNFYGKSITEFFTELENDTIQPER